MLLAGCTEAVRWPDRMNQPKPSARRPPPEPAPEGHYVVKPGDTLYSIAFRNQLDFRELAVWNDVGPDYLIRPGDVIRLTAPEVIASLPPGPQPVYPDDREPIGPGPQSTVPRSTYPPVTVPPATTPSTRVPPVTTTPRPAPEPEFGPISSWQWPARGKVIKPFSDGGKGIDIAGEVGQPVVAAGAGKVVYSGAALKGYGELIIIKHDDLHLSAYGYNRRRLVGEGVTVAAGQPIAEIGVGPEQKPALHFEIRRKGKPVDPAGYLPSR